MTSPMQSSGQVTCIFMMGSSRQGLASLKAAWKPLEPAISKEAAERRLVDELLNVFGGRSRPIMAHLADSGSLTLDDVREAEKTLMKLAKEAKSK